jgi:hypothetical protein
MIANGRECLPLTTNTCRSRRPSRHWRKDSMVNAPVAEGTSAAPDPWGDGTEARNGIINAGGYSGVVCRTVSE